MRILLAIIAALSFFLLPANHRLMSTGDDDDYFAVAASLAFGKFPSFVHEYHAGEKMPFASVGPGILAAPFVAVFSLGDRLSDAPIVAKREKENRYWTWSLLGFNFSAYFYLLLGTFFLYRALLYWGTRHAATITSFLSIVAGGGLLIYVFRRPVMSHAFEFFTVALAVFLVSRRLKEGEWRGMSLAVGVCAAFIFLTRYNNAFLAAALMATFLFLSYRSRKTIPIVEAVKMAAPFLLLVFVFRLLPVLVNGYSQFDQGYGGALSRLLPELDPVFYLNRGSDILFGWDMGLLFTAPAVLLGAVAAWRYRRTLPAEVMFLAAFSLLNIYFTMGWKSFGSFYGYRYICFTAMPFLAVPLVMFVDDILEFFGDVTTRVMAGLLAWFPLMSMAAFERSGKYGFALITNQYGEKTYSQPTYHRDLIQDVWLNPFSILGHAADTGVGAFLSAGLPPVQVAQRLLLYIGPPALFYLFYLCRKSFSNRRTTVPSRELMMNSPSNNLNDKLKSKTAVIGIVGLGYVGLPLMLRYTEVGYRVLGIDIDEGKIAKLKSGRSYIEHIPGTAISEANERGFSATSDFSRAREADALILCVPTPLNRYREPDMSFVLNTIDGLLPYLRPGQIVSLESTTYPGTTEEELLPRIESVGLKVGQDVFLVFSPEREDPGNENFSTRTIPKVCGGCTPACLEAGMALYGQVIDRVVPVSSTRAAELTKLLENIHRSVNIGLVNEMKIVADKMGIDIHEVIRAAATKPFGFVPYYPGPGLGGHCIPIDPFYLTWKAREYGVHTRFIELAGEVNSSMPDYVVSKVASALNEKRKSINGASILVLGIAYKKNVDDMRESPSVMLMEKLRGLGASVAYSDPHIPVFPNSHEHSFDLTSTEISPQTIGQFDLVLLATHHDKFDYAMILKFSKLIVDTRGVYLEKSSKVIKA